MMRTPVIAFISLLLLACTVVNAQAKRTPNLTFETFDGKTAELNDLRGSITVVNFWATWCAPCREEFPLLARLANEYSATKIRFVAISADEEPQSKKTQSKIRQFLAGHQSAMEVWVGADLDSLDRLKLGNELPATMILDPDGKIIARIEGQAREEDLRVPIEWLLKGQNTTPPAAVVRH